MNKELISKQMLDLTIKLAKINSGTFNVAGVTEVAEVLKQEVKSLNPDNHEELAVPPYDDLDETGKRIILPVGPLMSYTKRVDAPVQVLILAHMDTVFCKEHSFQDITKVSEDIIKGPGVSDMKGGIAVILQALKEFERSPEAKNLGWQLMFTPDEETGSYCSKEIILAAAKRHTVGFVFEPAMDEKGTLVGQRKGSGKIAIQVHGKSAHAGRHFHEGRNAICKMAEIIGKIHHLNELREGITINIGNIHGGDALNIVPSNCICHIDVRFAHSEDKAWLQAEIKNILDPIKVGGDYSYTLMEHYDKMPKILDAKHDKLYDLVVRTAKERGVDLEVKPTGGCSDGNNLTEAGLPNVDTLGVCGGKIHSDGEYLIVSSLYERAQLFKDILINLAKNGF